MPLFGPVWRKHGTVEPHECVPLWRFEGRCDMLNYIINFNATGGSEWVSTTNQAFMAIFGAAQDLVPWNPGANDDYPYTKILSPMFIKKVILFLDTNTFPYEFEFGLYKDQVRVKKLFTIEAQQAGMFPEIPSIAGQEFNIPLIFDHEYAFGFETTSGAIPVFGKNGDVMVGSVTSEVYFGSGNPY